MAVWWRGVQLDARSAAMMDEVAALCPGIPIDPTQGSWSGAAASAGTHTGTSAIDIAAVPLTPAQRDQVVRQMRRVGWCAWLRTPAQSDWPYHIHGIALAHPYEAEGAARGAQDQMADYEAGRNGLAGGAPDDGPRDWVTGGRGRTWEDYLAQEKQPPPDDDEEEDDMWMVARKASNGEAWLLCGTKARYGIYSGKMLGDAEKQGIPVLDLDDKTFNALIKGRETFTG